MISFRRYVLVLATSALIISAPHTSMSAQETPFTLGLGQSVTIGEYTLVFRGMTGSLPAYDLYSGSVLLARYPVTASPPNPAEYGYGNGRIGIATTGVAPDGSAVTGRMVVR